MFMYVIFFYLLYKTKEKLQECRGPTSGIINDKKIDVCKIYRTIIEECGLHHKSVTLMSLTGRILKQEWYFCNYILQLNPLLDPTGRDKVALEKIPFPDDLQLLSNYLDKKVSKNRVKSM